MPSDANNHGFQTVGLCTVVVDRVAVGMALLAPVAVLAAYQGMVTAGLVPLALFGPSYVVARAFSSDPERARVEGARVTAAASLGVALALVPALDILQGGTTLIPSRLMGLSVGLSAAGLGTLAGLATAPAPRELSPTEKRRWTLVRAVDRSHARGLLVLLAVALPAATLLGLLREAPIFAQGPGLSTLPDVLFGARAVGGRLVLPNAEASIALAIPLSLAPVAIGFLASPREATPIALGGIAVLAVTPVAIQLGIPVEAPSGGSVPLDLHPTPGVGALVALAPAGAGLLLGAGCVYVGERFAETRVVRRGLWAAVGALVAFGFVGLVPALALLLGIGLASLALSWRTHRAPLGAALAVGAVVGFLAGALGPTGEGMIVGTLVGIVAGGAVVAANTSRTLLLPQESVRSPRTLVYFLVMASLGGALTWLASAHAPGVEGAFALPHARSLAAAIEALITSQGDLILVWGVVAGGLIQWQVGRGALFALGFLVGPGVALLVLVGSLLRALWEGALLDRARDGFVMRGEMGYELLRAHVLVVAVLAGEAIAVALGPLIR